MTIFFPIPSLSGIVILKSFLSLDMISKTLSGDVGLKLCAVDFSCGGIDKKRDLEGIVLAYTFARSFATLRGLSFFSDSW